MRHLFYQLPNPLPDLRRGRVRLALAVLALMAFVVWVVSQSGVRTAGADEDVTVVRVSVPPPTDEATGEEVHREVVREVAKRLRLRLKASGLKHWEVDETQPPDLRVVVRGGVDRALVAGIVIPPGRMQLRPMRPAGRTWLRVSGALPADVELRQPNDSLASGDAYLWSKRRASLSGFLERVALVGADGFVFPDAGGWRSVALGPPTATERHIAAADLERSRNGQIFVRLDLGDALAGPRLDDGPARWGLVVDGELVAVFQRDFERSPGALNVLPPDHLNSEQARLLWARQIAARLAAPISVPLVEWHE